MGVRISPPVLNLGIVNNILQFLKDSYFELSQKVFWPKFSTLQSQATLVLIASLIFALIIGGIDWVFKTILDLWYSPGA
ncbi:MAG: preprotein translocase subunit SecE [Thermonemataceae bacterium]